MASQSRHYHSPSGDWETSGKDEEIQRCIHYARDDCAVNEGTSHHTRTLHKKKGSSDLRDDYQNDANAAQAGDTAPDPSPPLPPGNSANS